MGWIEATFWGVALAGVAGLATGFVAGAGTAGVVAAARTAGCAGCPAEADWMVGGAGWAPTGMVMAGGGGI
jgi:hypothetical protein